jgi:hypothetical protein
MSINTNAPTDQVGAFDKTSKAIMTPFLTHALNLSGRGWHVFPLKPMDKTPLTTNGYKNATTDANQIREWMNRWPTANIGIATEASGLLVIDCDSPKGGIVRPEKWAKDGINDGADVLATVATEYGSVYPSHTYTTKTPNNGWHHYFNDNQIPVKSCAGANSMWLVDVRSRGGYIVAAGSVLPSGVYQHGVVDEVVDCPDWVRKAVTYAKSQSTISYTSTKFSTLKVTSNGHAELSIKKVISELQCASIGTRNDSLNRAAFIIGCLVQKNPEMHQAAFNLLSATALAIGLSEQESARTIKSAYLVGLRGTKND